MTAPDGSETVLTGLTLSEALRSPRFWKITISLMLLTLVYSGMAAALPFLLRSQGATPSTSAMVMVLLGVGTFAGRVVDGITLDRWFAPSVVIAITLVSMLAFIMLALIPNPRTMAIAAALIGLGLGAEFAAGAYIASRAYGRRALGATLGVQSLGVSLGVPIGGTAIGASFAEGMIQPQIVFGASFAVLLAAVAIMRSLSRSELPFGVSH